MKGRRIEFSRRVYITIFERACRGFNIFPFCEVCGGEAKRYEIHHKEMDAMQVEPKTLTADMGILVCLPCHKAMTAKQLPILAKAKRQEASHKGLKTPKQKIQSRGFQKKERKVKEPVFGLPAYARQMRDT